MTPGRRLRKMMVAMPLGWIAGMVLALPVLLADVVRSTGGDWVLLLVALGSNVASLSVAGLAIAVAAWLIVAVPVVLVAKPDFLLRYSVLILCGAALAGTGLVALMLRLWVQWEPDAITALVFWERAVFTICFAVATTGMYLRLLRRES